MNRHSTPATSDTRMPIESDRKAKLARNPEASMPATDRILNAIAKIRPTRGALVLTAVLLGACASTPEADRERDLEAKRFEPVTRDAVVYVYRPDMGNTAADTTLWANGRLVGTSIPRTFFRIIVLPGRTHFHASGSDSGTIEVMAGGNEVTYVEMQTLNPDSPSSHFRVVSAEHAQAAIRACCTMLEVWRPGQPRLWLW